MVSEDSPSNSHSSILHQFIISNSIANTQNQFQNHHFDTYPHSLPSSTLQYHPHQFSDESEVSNGSRLIDLLGTANETAAQRLSLSLGSIPCSQTNFNSYLMNNNGYSFSGNPFTYGASSISPIIGSSKYLKPAQALLEEMVSVGCKEIDISNKKYVEKLCRGTRSFGISPELKAEFSNSETLGEGHGGCVTLLKLLSLLEEVERRYGHYYHHMDELVTSFEAIAGFEAGKTYTSLALQAMSKHFCTLRKAILTQIRIAKQRIAKDMPKLSSRLSQLSLLDHNRTPLQQIGIMQNSRAWRPIRGLPETSVTILRAWLFEHFLNPYPNDSEKLMLSSQTGLSKNQVSNWFINARVRLWKPMIEEMYKDEFAEDFSIEREGTGDSVEDLN